ncbi:hypothetical protein ACEPAF_7623 [Sanghuangporus sanghuang]
MLVAAQSPSVVLQSPTRTVPTHLDAYQIPVPVTPVPPLAAPFSIHAPLPLPTPNPIPIPVHVPVPIQLPALVVQETPPPPRPEVEVPVHERLFAAQLAHLASGHHLSEYNRLKNERQRGSVAAYVPFSLQAPAQVRELRARQAQNSERQSWWISERSGCDTLEKFPCLVAQHNSEEQGLPTMVTGPISDISQEISAAISSQMITTHITKTSQSHPINISMVIPSDALLAIASRLVSSSSASPILFHIPDNYHLDRLTAPFSRGYLTCSPFYRPGHPSYPSMARQPVSLTWSEQGSNELQNALKGEISLPPRPLYVPSQDIHGIHPPSKFPHLPALPHPAPLPPSPPRGVVRRRQRHGRATSAPPVFRTFKNSQRRVSNLKDPWQCLVRNRSSPEVPTKRLEVLPSVVPSPSVISESRPSKQANQQDELTNGNGAIGLMLPPSLPSGLPNTLPQVASASIDETQMQNPVGVQHLGNLYLSSCPGKKVRLTGPVKGRGAICRDLRSDLSRMKEIGTACVICCLDDEELDYLGASWNEYVGIANELGLDVLRIPMPEGLTPLSPASLDAQLKHIIESYTLRGLHVLAHCRGGMGRAGLVACCWMIKLGLLGWKDPEICAKSCSKHSQCQNPCMTWSNTEILNGPSQQFLQTQATPNLSPMANRNNQISNSLTSLPADVPRVCRGTLQLVERALIVIRRRRSLKAIETYEQVRFLVEFIAHIDAEARRGHIEDVN